MIVFNYFVEKAGFIYVIQLDVSKEIHFQQTSKRYDDVFDNGNIVGIWKIKYKN